MYCQRIIEEFNNPFNMFIPDRYDYLIQNINDGCGDEAYIYISYDGERITSANFQAFGCAACLAVTSFLCRSISGKALAEVKALNRDHFEKAFNELEPSQRHCIDMAEVLTGKILATIENGLGNTSGNM